MKYLNQILSHKKTTTGLLVLVVISSFIAAYIGYSTPFYDAIYYEYLADGIKQNIYSPWYFLDIYTPDTLRTFGYPAFLVLVRTASESPICLVLCQLSLYWLSIYFVCHRIYSVSGTAGRNLFLLILIPSIQVPFYAGQTASEMLTIFLICLSVYTYYSDLTKYKKSILLGAVYAAIFYVKPVFLLFPFLFLVFELTKNRSREILLTQCTLIVTFVCSILPYAFWNLHAHGYFKLTPLEGGAGVMHVGFWQHKLPGYQDYNYWMHNMGKEPFQFAEAENFEENVSAYLGEWEAINQKTKKHWSTQDSIRESLMTANNPGMFNVYSSDYTIARERALIESFFSSVLNEPWYFFKTRLYTSIRIWITGINLTKWNSKSWVDKIAGIYPFLITVTIIGLGLLMVFIGLIKKEIGISKYGLELFLILYFGIIHIPFSIQSRYSVPVHLLVMLLTSVHLTHRIRN